MLILDPKIPYHVDLKRAIVITYRGKQLVTTEESFKSGSYRMEFIAEHGICLPLFDGKTTMYYSPNLEELVDIKLDCATDTCEGE